MTFVYLILAHKNPEQLKRMIKALNAEGVNFYVHIDLKSDENAFKETVVGQNIFFCKRRLAVNWGGYSMIEATMQLIKEMAEQQGFPDYVHLLSGQDFPIKNNETIFDYFRQNNGCNFIEYNSLPCSNWGAGGMNRILFDWRIDELGFKKSAELVSKQEKHSFLQGYQPYGGSQWWSLTGECVKFILDSYLEGGELFDFYRHTLCSDEMLFQTFLVNSEYKKTLISNNLRKIDWKPDSEQPKIWKKENFYELMTASELFARKFDETIDPVILGKINNRIMGKQTYDSSDCPLVSVVVPAYNVEKYIKDAIDSILSQTFGDFELIIVDDGSEDNTTNIIKSYRDKRIKLIEMPHNFIDSLNAGMDVACGKYIARMDADDIMEPERLEVQVEYMETHVDIDACGSYANFMGFSDELIHVPLSHIDIACSMFSGNAIIHPSSFIRRKSLRYKHIRYNNDYIYAEDYKFWTDMIMQGGKLANIPYSLMKYRCCESQVTRVHYHEMCLVSEKIRQEYLDDAINKLCAVGEDAVNYIAMLHNMVSQGSLSSGQFLAVIKKMYANLIKNE